MTERNFRTFNSWDEVSPGDTLLWIVDGKYGGYTVEYVSPNGPRAFIATPIESRVPSFGGGEVNDDWCVDIYPNQMSFKTVGWALPDYKLFKYDPTQQPEDDSI